MGGAIEILPPLVPTHESLYGEIDLLTRSVNALYGGSLMLGKRAGRWFFDFVTPRRHFGDIRVPASELSILRR